MNRDKPFGNSPSIYDVRDIVRSADTMQKQLSNGLWVPCRPIGYPSIRRRFKAAWLVFIGRADAVIWPEQ